VGRARVMVLAGIVTWASVSPGRVMNLVVRKSIAVAAGENIDPCGDKVWVLGVVEMEAAVVVAKAAVKIVIQRRTGKSVEWGRSMATMRMPQTRFVLLVEMKITLLNGNL
jgi:hypothetical protein